MNKRKATFLRLVTGSLAITLLAAFLPAGAVIPGVTGTTFALTVKEGHLTAGDGGSIYAWGYALAGGLMQYPGPVMIVNEGASITVTLINELPASAGNVSIIFPGHQVVATGGQQGLLTREAPPDGTTQVTYNFTAGQPGTFVYYSGTRTTLQVEMGLVGVIIVRPSGYDPDDAGNRRAYAHADSRYDHEYLFFLSEMDSRFHEQVTFRGLHTVDEVNTFNHYFPNYFFINGRTAPDVFSPAEAGWLPHQPYNCFPRTHPGEKVLLRVAGGGLKRHPFHVHGNHSRVIAKDGQFLTSNPALGANLGYWVFTVESVPGETVDSIFTWTGAGLGWDVYGHAQDIDNDPSGWSTGGSKGPEDIDHNGDGVFDSVPLAPGEDPADHGKPFPVTMPDNQSLTFGPFYSGSPFMGTLGALPPGEGGLNPNGGFVFMWHSHDEKELINFGLFPGGMLTMMIVEPPGVPIP